jgi:integrase/recombinase XerD
MEIVTLKPLIHRNQENIGIFFKHSQQLILIIKKLLGVKWSQTHKCWYLPLSKENHIAITNSIGKVAKIDNSLLKVFLEKRKQVVATIVTIQKNATEKPISHTPAFKLSPVNRGALERFIEQLKLKAYSPATIKTYRNEFMQLLQLLKTKPVSELSPTDLRRYMLYAMEKEGIKENTAHSRLNALKFYFEQVLGREKFFWEIPRPKKPQQLPKLLNEDELRKLFNALSNKKHKAMLFTAYSAGLRVSEIVQLKLKHIDSSRMQIFVERAKGKKDRYVNLSLFCLIF